MGLESPRAAAATVTAIQATIGKQQTDVGYDIVILAGQSNMSGAGTSFDTVHYDALSPGRVMQWAGYGTYAGAITAISIPYYCPDWAIASGQSTKGLGPGHWFSKFYEMLMPTNRKLLLVPTSYGGTGFEGQDSHSLGRNWKIGTAQSQDTTTSPSTGNLALYPQMIALAKSALAASPPNSRIVAVLWHQGEQDASNGTSASTYATDLDALIAQTRTDLGVPGLPFIVGQMTYENRISDASHVAIDGVHTATPTRQPLTGFAPGPGAGFTDPVNGTIHYSAAGQRILGYNYFAAYQASLTNVLGNPPVAPGSVTVAQSGNSAAVVTWTRTGGRVTDYTYGYSTNGGTSWTTVAHTASPAQTFTITGLSTGNTVLARVSTVNEQGSSAYTTSSSLTLGAVPSQVTGLAGGTVTPTTIPLTWNVASGATSYLVEQSVDNTNWTTVGTVTTNAATLTGLTASTTYYARVTGINSAGNGSTSAVLTTASGYSTYPTTSLLAHYSAATAASAGVVNGGAVTSLATVDGGSYPLSSTGTTSPTLKTGAINSLPSIVFDGTGGRLDATTPTQTALSTMILVARLTTVTASGTILAMVDGTDTGVTKRLLSNGTTATFEFVGNGTNTTNQNSGVALDTNYHVIGIQFNATSSVVRIGPTVTTGLATTGTGTGIRLGASRSGSSYTPEEIAEIFFYNAVLSTTDWNNVFSYLGTKYGLSV